MAKNNDESTVLASNRRARHDYTILDVVEAGIVLHGSEVKSVREGLVQIAESYAMKKSSLARIILLRHVNDYSRNRLFI